MIQKVAWDERRTGRQTSSEQQILVKHDSIYVQGFVSNLVHSTHSNSLFEGGSSTNLL